MSIAFLKNKEIDRVKWDYCIENSCNGTIYAMSWYLDAVAENWDALIAGDYEAVFPVTYVKKFGIKILYTPNCVQQLGLFAQQQPSGELLITFLKAIPKKFLFGTLQLNSQNILPPDCGFQIKKRDNIEQNICTPIHVLRKNYGRNITENLRKARKNNIYIAPSTNFRNTIETYRANRGQERYYIGEKYYVSAYQLMETLTEKQLLVIHEAYNAEDKFVAGVIAAPFKNKIVLMQLGCNPDGYRTGATSLLIDSILERFAETKEICDFEGSGTPSVAYFYTGFGGSIVHYPEVSIENIPKFLIKIMFQVRKIKSFVYGKNFSKEKYNH
jgi:hypothetical protein